MEDMFNFWIVYEPNDDENSDILSGLLFKLTKGNRRNRFCFVCSNLNLYNKIKRSPGGTVKKVAIELANVL